MNTSLGTVCKYQGHVVQVVEETAIHTRRIRFLGADMHGEACLVGANTLTPCPEAEINEVVMSMSMSQAMEVLNLQCTLIETRIRQG